MQTLLTAFILTVGSFVGVCDDNPYRVHNQAAIAAAAGTPWSAARHLFLVERVNEQFLTQIVLPYPIAQDDLKGLYGKQKTVPFFAYSSMIDPESAAAQAISPTGRSSFQPAVAFGIQRVFNRELDHKVVTAKFGPLRRDNDLAILNAFEKQDVAVNGVLFNLTLPDLLILANREVGYDLIPVPVILWDEAMGDEEPSIIVAYTFRAPDYIGEGTRYTNPAINPIPQYVALLQKGIQQLGEDFEAMWWATTYLADKKTPLSEMPYHEVDCGE